MLVEAAVLDREHRLLMRGGIADSATGRRFSRSPPSARQQRRVERRAARSACAPSSSRSHAIGDARRRRPSRRFAAGRGAGGCWKTTRTTWPLSSGARGMIATAPCADRELAGLLDRVALRVAEIVQPIDQLPLGQRLAAAQLERPREDARQHAVALAVQPRVDQAREADVVVAGGDAAATTTGTASDRAAMRTQRWRHERGDADSDAQPPDVRAAARSAASRW